MGRRRPNFPPITIKDRSNRACSRIACFFFGASLDKTYHTPKCEPGIREQKTTGVSGGLKPLHPKKLKFMSGSEQILTFPRATQDTLSLRKFQREWVILQEVFKAPFLLLTSNTKPWISIRFGTERGCRPLRCYVGGCERGRGVIQQRIGMMNFRRIFLPRQTSHFVRWRDYDSPTVTYLRIKVTNNNVCSVGQNFEPSYLSDDICLWLENKRPVSKKLLEWHMCWTVVRAHDVFTFGPYNTIGPARQTRW